ncbi:MAG: hypothetical protein EP349_02605 [Alphaproteobacteria bacterium]|nr:MAG: hypothetical protein EP349_02605 [Alphaproteobacteria bacterium]
MRFLRYMWICVFFCGMALALPLHQAAASTPEKPEAEKKDGELEYVDMNPILLPVISREGKTQNISILISIGIDQGRKPFLEGYQPRLANAYIQTLYSMFDNGEAIRPNGAFDAEKVQTRLLAVTENMLHDNEHLKVHDLLLKAMQARASN